MTYDAVLLVSFGGPEGPDEVMPFLENVLRGKNVPQQRILAVAEHYQRFGGVSPINAQNRALVAALRAELDAHGLHLPIYWGNRNWRPLLPDTLRQMAADKIQHALAFVTSAFSSYSGCRQYLEDIQRAREAVGITAPQVDKLRVFFNHPDFILAMATQVAAAYAQLPAADRDSAPLIFSAHSIPLAMAKACAYEAQLQEACRLVNEQLPHGVPWTLVYQSRSGPPGQPWLEPDICDYLERLGKSGQVGNVVVAPIGFLCEHIEVLYDLDLQARAVCDRFGIQMVRSQVVGGCGRFVAMIRELIEERLGDQTQRLTLGSIGPCPDVCPPGCCLLEEGTKGQRDRGTEGQRDGGTEGGGR
jgi:ferrochelatase